MSKRIEPDYRIAVHFLPMPDRTWNVRCLNGYVHRRDSSDIKDVTCELCLNPSTHAEYWSEKRNGFK